MNKKKVLISGVGGSLFPYLINLLKDKYDLFLIDSNKIIKKIYPKNNVFIVPMVKNNTYEKVVEDIIDQNNIEYYIPLIDEELPKALNIANYNSHLKIISPNKYFVNICLNKYLLMKELSKNKISKVETYKGTDFNPNFKFPIFVKPIVGRGSRGICKIENIMKYKAYFNLENYDAKEIMVQEYLDGEEYSVSVVVNNLNRLIAVVPKRIIFKRGVTQHAVTENNENIKSVCENIVDIFKPCGPFNVQLKIVKGKIKIFEINPRFSTTSILTCEASINEFELCIEAYDKHDISYINDFKENLYLYRRWESLFYEIK